MKPIYSRKYILASIASAFVMFALAGVWNMVIVKQLGLVEIPQSILRDRPILPLVVIGYLALAFVLIYTGLRSRFAVNARWHWVVVGVLVMETAFGLSGIVLQANYNFPLRAIPLDLFWYLIEGAAGGLAAYYFFRDGGTYMGGRLRKEGKTPE